MPHGHRCGEGLVQQPGGLLPPETVQQPRRLQTLLARLPNLGAASPGQVTCAGSGSGGGDSSGSAAAAAESRGRGISDSTGGMGSDSTGPSGCTGPATAPGPVAEGWTTGEQEALPGGAAQLAEEPPDCTVGQDLIWKMAGLELSPGQVPMRGEIRARAGFEREAAVSTETCSISSTSSGDGHGAASSTPSSSARRSSLAGETSLEEAGGGTRAAGEEDPWRALAALLPLLASQVIDRGTGTDAAAEEESAAAVGEQREVRELAGAWARLAAPGTGAEGHAVAVARDVLLRLAMHEEASARHRELQRLAARFVAAVPRHSSGRPAPGCAEAPVYVGDALLGELLRNLRGLRGPARQPAAPQRPRCQRAYCSLLHGPDEHFFVYALVVGARLRRFCAGAERVLLCAGRWWEDRAARSALARFYTELRHVQLIHAPHATRVPRHSWVFSKIQAMRLAYRHLVFLDLDLVLRADLAPLFEVPAPAGMHHGDCKGSQLAHGEPIATDQSWWCVNAGVMRLDPCTTRRARHQDVASMLHEVKHIRYPTALPEQYYLAGRLEGWRHIDPKWNMEVGLTYDDPGFTWPRPDARKAALAPRGRMWLQQATEDARVFHFSGTKLHPWWYADLDPQAAYNEAAERWRHRDPRRLVATALREWCVALDELLAEVAHWPAEERCVVEAAVRRLTDDAAAHRRKAKAWNSRPMCCRRCRSWFAPAEGRWLLGWEGWWLCSDCVVGYILSDEEPEPLRCWACGGQGPGRWEWARGRPWWRCACPHLCEGAR